MSYKSLKLFTFFGTPCSIFTTEVDTNNWRIVV